MYISRYFAVFPHSGFEVALTCSEIFGSVELYLLSPPNSIYKNAHSTKFLTMLSIKTWNFSVSLALLVLLTSICYVETEGK